MINIDAAVLNYIHAHKLVRTETLVEQLGISESTARRSLSRLCKANRISRFHGGASIIEAYEETSVSERRAGISSELKDSIARKAAGFVQPGSHIILLGGTTVAAMCPYLSGKNLTVITSSMLVMNRLSNDKGTRIILLGGEYDYAENETFGFLSRDALRHFHVDCLFLSSAAFNEDSGFMTDAPHTIEFYRQCFTATKKVYMLADSGKYGKRGASVIARAADLYGLISDRGLPLAAAARFAADGLQIYLTDWAMERYRSYREIHEQDESLRQTLAYMSAQRDKLAGYCGKGDIVFIADGSNCWLSHSASGTLHNRLGKRQIFSVNASEAMLSPEDYAARYDRPLFICPSRSGRTVEMLRAVEMMKNLYPSSKVLAIVCNNNSPLEAIADKTLRLPWVKEDSVYRTYSFSNLYLASILLADIWTGNDILFSGAARYLSAAAGLYATHREIVAGIAAKRPESIVCLGYGRRYGIAVEGAHIIMEMAGQNANYFQLTEYHHGPIATSGPNTYVFIPSATGNIEFEADRVAEIEATGAHVYAVACHETGYGTTLTMSDLYPDEIVALHFSFCLQSLAFHLALVNRKMSVGAGCFS